MSAGVTRLRNGLVVTPLALAACLSTIPMVGPGAQAVPVQIENHVSDESVQVELQPAAGEVKPCTFVPCKRCLSSGTALLNVAFGSHRYERHVLIPLTPSRVLVKRNYPAAFFAGLSLAVGSLGFFTAAGAISDTISTTASSWWVNPNWETTVAQLQAAQLSIALIGLVSAVTGLTLVFTNMKRDRVEVKPWPDPPAALTQACAGTSDKSASPSTLPPVSAPQAKPERPDMLYVAGLSATIALPSFFIDRKEVTVSRYRDCVHAGKCQEPGTGELCTWGHLGGGSSAVNCVDQSQAAAYCDFVHKQLPTDAEWRYLLEHYATRLGNLQSSSSSQGSLQSGAGTASFGLFDLVGNVWEWSSARSGMSWGGGWDTMLPDDGDLTKLRNAVAPTLRLPTLGFRCAARPAPAP